MKSESHGEQIRTRFERGKTEKVNEKIAKQLSLFFFSFHSEVVSNLVVNPRLDRLMSIRAELIHSIKGITGCRLTD